MRHSIGLATAALAAAVLLGAAPAQAADTGFYVGGFVGASSFDVQEEDLAGVADVLAGTGLSFTIDRSSLDDDDTAFGGLVGYRFLPWLAAEARYVDLGEAKYDASGTISTVESAPLPFDLGLKAKVKGPALSVLGILPFADRWEVYARGEVLFTEVKLEVAASAVGNAAAESDTSNSTDFGLGVGVGVNLGPNWALRAEYERFFDVGDQQDTGESDVDLVSVQALYRF